MALFMRGWLGVDGLLGNLYVRENEAMLLLSCLFMFRSFQRLSDGCHWLRIF